MDIIEAPGNAPVQAAEEWNEEEIKELESQEWIDSLDYLLDSGGHQRVTEILKELAVHAHQIGVNLPFSANTPYMNTIPANKQPAYPGSREIERRINTDETGHFLIEGQLPATTVMLSMDGYTETDGNVDRFLYESSEIELIDKQIMDLGRISFEHSESNVDVDG